MKNTDIDWNNLTQEKARFIFEQAKESLSSTIYIANKLEQKAFVVFGLSNFVMNVIILFIYSQYQSLGYLLYPILLYLLVLIICNILLVLAIKPTQWYVTGNLPSIFLNNTILEQSIDYIIIGEAQNYTERIELNDKQNKIKAKYLQIALGIFTYSSIILFILYILINYSY